MEQPRQKLLQPGVVGLSGLHAKFSLAVANLQSLAGTGALDQLSPRRRGTGSQPAGKLLCLHTSDLCAPNRYRNNTHRKKLNSPRQSLPLESKASAAALRPTLPADTARKRPGLISSVRKYTLNV